MSRCFPYAPPGYALSSARNDALIESIKLQKPKVQAEEQRKKEKKREKKEKKKDKKEKKDKRSQNQGNSDSVYGNFGEKFSTDGKEGKDDSVQLERSSLTEEHAEPVYLRGPSSSSDSTENSNKRKRLPSPVDVSRGHGKIIRIRLSTKKQSQSDSSTIEELKHCSTSSRIQAPPQKKNDASLGQRSAGFCSTSGSISNVKQCLVLKTGGERIHVASNHKTVLPLNPSPFETKAFSAAPKQIKNVVESKVLPAASNPIMADSPFGTKALPVANTVSTAMHKEGLLYQNLMENWVPPQMCGSGDDNRDEDWLFGSKTKLEVSEKKLVCREDSIPCSNTSSRWPCAQYIPEVDLFALPFTVPF
ncbi:uncharacterized protein LOC121807061 [Salvia splendens]|uniref:uncharacterized protein LOC121807061 n=1 Tax=Salvia splendens TaxID=180675 RepID=UPI001100A066|nr:uncharacterized protein LOC121807061 [Salvia splendens]